MNQISKKELIVVFVAALGYFVDAYDLILFIVVRKPSLIEMGVLLPQISEVGLSLFNTQMVGMLLGGIFFGILGDKKGRLSVLFGSILLYSLANILNGFAHNLNQYYILRFIAGIGLAGELGAGITLVAETMPQNLRGYGTAIVAAAGALGAFAAGLIGDVFLWRNSYFIGGLMGLLLLLLRFSTMESKMFEKSKNTNIDHGNFLSLFTNWLKFKKFLAIILISLPVYFVITILMQLSSEVAKALHITANLKVGTAVMLVYAGLGCGDLASGLLSQYLKNRKKCIQIFIIFGAIMSVLHLSLPGISLQLLYISYFLLGFGVGFWVTLLTLSAEQFGTNIRATVATTIPNFARGAAVPISMLFTWIHNFQNLLNSAMLTGIFCFSLSFISTFFIEDTFSKNLDFTE